MGRASQLVWQAGVVFSLAGLSTALSPACGAMSSTRDGQTTETETDTVAPIASPSPLPTTAVAPTTATTDAGGFDHCSCSVQEHPWDTEFDVTNSEFLQNADASAAPLDAKIMLITHRSTETMANDQRFIVNYEVEGKLHAVQYRMLPHTVR